jgi:hypothetical protein
MKYERKKPDGDSTRIEFDPAIDRAVARLLLLPATVFVAAVAHGLGLGPWT